MSQVTRNSGSSSRVVRADRVDAARSAREDAVGAVDRPPARNDDGGDAPDEVEADDERAPDRRVSEGGDAELVAATLAGDDQAFEALVGRYESRLRRLAYGFVRDHAIAEDIAQDTFLQALRRLASLKNPASLRSWLFSIAVNRARDELRRRGRLPVQEEEEHDDEPADPADGEAAARSRQLRTQLGRLIAGLPDKYRVPLVLKEVEGMTYAEIAAQLEIPMGTAQIRIHRARLRLRESLTALGHGPAAEESTR